MMTCLHLGLTRSMTLIPKNSQASGFSLIELMIAIVIALFLSAGMIAVVISMKGSFTTQNQLSRVQDSQRFALTALNNTVRAAGYYPDPTTSTANDALPAAATANPDGTTFADGQGITAITGSGAASDTLNVRFQTASGDGLMNCLGETNTSGSPITWGNSFAINASNQLTCTVSTNGGHHGSASVLVDHVSAMKVLYGVDTSGDGSADAYLSSADVDAGKYWQAVLSAQINISFLDLLNSKRGASISLPALAHTIRLMNKP